MAFSNSNNKITSLMYKKTHTPHSKEQHKFTKIIPEEVQIAVLLDKDFKTTVLTKLSEGRETGKCAHTK